MFKECLKYSIVLFITEDHLKLFYYCGLKEWNNKKGYICRMNGKWEERYDSIFWIKK